MTVSKIKLLVIMAVSAFIGAFGEYAHINLNKDEYMLMIAKNSYFIGCVRESGELSACKDLADKWRISVQNAVGITP